MIFFTAIEKDFEANHFLVRSFTGIQNLFQKVVDE